MAEMKNICGKIPMELHTKVRQEIEQREKIGRASCRESG